MSKILFSLCFIFPQLFTTSNNFDDKIKEGVVVVEFWAEWNKKNEVKYLGKLEGCKKYRLNIIEHSAIQKRYKIFSIPTVILFKNGELINRYSPNIMLQLETTQEEIQNDINKLLK